MSRTLLLLAACIAACKCLENIDLQEPIVRLAPSELNDEGYFGYKIVLHQKQTASTFSGNLGNTYIIVGAPNGTRTNSATTNTGFVYECPITVNGACTRIPTLSDDSSNDDEENKEGQFMGGALASNGDRFIACGHRYVNFNPENLNDRSVFGRCYYADRDLEDFEEYQPCAGIGRRRSSSVGVCQAGMSAEIAETSDGRDHLIVGAPGTYLWRGVLIRATPEAGTFFLQPYETTSQNSFSLQGYSLTKGFFRTLNVEDLATSVPRLGSYFGAVHIIRNSDLQLVSQNLVGEQMGEYYGFALAALNLAGDGLDELLVSAPMYRDRTIGAETGRVYVYSNFQGTLNRVTTLVGTKAYGRFGHAMVSLGDISGDGFEDVAISAPFGDGTGTVFIYHSSSTNLLNPIPQQIITPDRLNLMPDVIARFESLGTSLASLDVDGNGVNDLAIGSYEDQTVCLLRTRPLAQVTTALTANPGIINRESGNMADYNGDDFVFFTVTLTLQYTGQGSIELDIELTAESARRALGLQQRLFFDDGAANEKPSTASETYTATSGQMRTFTFRMFVEKDIADFLNGFVIDLKIMTDDFQRAPSDGNVNPTNLEQYPVVAINGPNSVQVEIQNDCDNPCISNLAVTTNGPVQYFNSEGGPLDRLTVGLATDIVVPLRITNLASNAFLAQLIFTLPIQQLSYNGINDSLIICNPGNGNGRDRPYICDIGNPFRNITTRYIEFRFTPQSSLTGEEGNIPIVFNVTSLNEDQDELMDNRIGVTLEVNTEANIFVDEGIVIPDQVNHPAQPLNETLIVDVTDLGSEFTTTFTVGNLGPSIIPNAVLTIHWPLRVRNSDLFFLYPTGWRAIQSSSVSVSCMATHFNPNNYAIEATEEDDDNSGEPGLSEGRRRKRSLGGLKPRQRRRRNTRYRRQDMEDTIPTTERTVSCNPGERNNPNNNHTCAAIECNIRQLSADNRVQIEITAVVDERHLGGNRDIFTFRPVAEVEIVGADHINERDTDDNTASAEFRSNPNTVTVNRTPPGGQDNNTTEVDEGDSSSESVPWYAIAIPIIAAVIFFIIAGVVLYFCGFFSRKNKQQIEDEARDNLAAETDTNGGTDM